jgi:hypothetical protein
LTSFLAWAKAHDGEPCPDVEALGVTASDPWGHPLVVTCTGQPSTQIIGIVSGGPDGTHGTADDIASWEIDRDLVRGARWVTKVAAKQPADPRAKKPGEARKPTDPTKPSPVVDPFAPTKPKPVVKPTIEYDENGIPIRR